MHLSYTDKLDMVVVPQEHEDFMGFQKAFLYGSHAPSDEDKRVFTRMLKRYGLSKEEKDIMTQKYVEGKTIAQIAKDSGFVSEGAAGYFFRTVKRKMAKMGLIKKGKK